MPSKKHIELKISFIFDLKSSWLFILTKYFVFFQDRLAPTVLLDNSTESIKSILSTGAVAGKARPATVTAPGGDEKKPESTTAVHTPDRRNSVDIICEVEPLPQNKWEFRNFFLTDLNCPFLYMRFKHPLLLIQHNSHSVSECSVKAKCLYFVK